MVVKSWPIRTVAPFAQAALSSLVAADRHRERRPDARVVLALGVQDAVQIRLPSRVPRPVHRQPQPRLERVDDVRLERGDRILREAIAAEEVRVRGEEPDARVGLETSTCRPGRTNPSSGLNAQRLLPMLISFVGSYCPAGIRTFKLAPSVVRGAA